ncbi:polysaccharide biosynthesis/export family protein [Reyranella soli]|uniref:Capsular polysaccharide biosynthesis protein n=1 Tax=Reyranella soli TaxID=1230389 RepID=A0A512NI56_9HYPH|nr:polysaccharide biosynthesis/export family protein [Reyranella soli]GEP58631.1 capsular polysaccharide biosynthesis protein [Reyranella soli]
MEVGVGNIFWKISEISNSVQMCREVCNNGGARQPRVQGSDQAVMSATGGFGESVGRWMAAAAFCLCLAGCDLLPSDGPNANGMLAHASENKKADPASVMRFALVTVDSRIARDAEQYYQPVIPTVPAVFQRPGAFGRAGVGDVLQVTIWEASDTGVFAGKDRKASDVTVRVDVDGTIALPYAGRFMASGKRVSDIEKDIVSRLEGKAVDPQATVMVVQNVSSSASVQGDVNKPGPYPLDRSDQRVLDMIALAGGTKYPPYETSLRLTRGRSTMSIQMQELVDRPEIFNVSVAAGDALLLVRKPQKFVAFGAVQQPGEQIFRRLPLNMTDALGQTIGLEASRADAKGVYLFRREPVALARRYGVQLLAEDRETVPIVYQLNLKDPQSFFAMNAFPVRPGDILFVSQAPLADAAKFFQILSGATATVAIPRTLGGNFPSGN